MQTSIELLKRAQTGDEAALNELCHRYRAPLLEWAHARMPRGIFSMQDTEDLVQETLVRTLSHLEKFEPRHEGALLAYIRQAMKNRIRDQFRHRNRRPTAVELPEDSPDRAPSPLQELIGKQAMEAYEQALQRLQPMQQQGLIAKLEFGKSNQEIADLLGKPSADAARVFVARSLLVLAQEMDATR